MDQMQPPKRDLCGQTQDCCCFSFIRGGGLIKGSLLIALGLYIAMPTLGQYFGIPQNNVLTQYSHIFLGAGFIGWGAMGVIAGLFRLFSKK